MRNVWRKTKKLSILFALLLSILLSLPVTSRADFGGFSGNSDYDYDSGWSPGDSYDDDDDDYYGYQGSDVSPDDISGLGIFLGILTMAVAAAPIYFINHLINRRKEKMEKAIRCESEDSDKMSGSIRDYMALDPNFNSEALCEKAANLYVQMQNGWTAKDIEALRPYFTDALFTQMERSLQELVRRGETNVVERIAVMEVNPKGFRRSAGEDIITLRLETRITDYTVNDSTQQVVSGSREMEKFMTYEWDLQRPAGMKTAAGSSETRRITCPACGAPLDVNASARCPYCGSVIQQKEQDWTIRAIRGIRQVTDQTGELGEEMEEGV